MMYYPVRALSATPSDYGIDYESVDFATDDGLKLNGWWIPAANERAVLLFFHGNAGNIGDRLESVEIFRRLGLTVFIVDYRGYGISEGRPSEKGTYLDGRAAWKYLTEERGIDPSHIVLFGRSLGAAVATELAVAHPPRALILESAFTSVPDMASRLFPWLPVRHVLGMRYDNLKRIGDIDRPLLIVHSRDDEIIPFEHGRRLFEAAAEPKEFLEIRHGHNDGFVLSGALYSDGLAAFLARYVY
jgi:fermentation-respiration switch protein FrsA (DUF1100 family)